jgi:hypothetical protein
VNSLVLKCIQRQLGYEKSPFILLRFVHSTDTLDILRLFMFSLSLGKDSIHSITSWKVEICRALKINLAKTRPLQATLSSLTVHPSAKLDTELQSGPQAESTPLITLARRQTNQ